MNKTTELLKREEEFHDEWANAVDPSTVLARELDSVCTLPETRTLFKKLGDVRGKRIVELGCGCGEASVYFALHGAEVTATDISSGMLRLVSRVAAFHGVEIQTHQCSADVTGLPAESYDIVYAANLLQSR